MGIRMHCNDSTINKPGSKISEPGDKVGLKTKIEMGEFPVDFSECGFLWMRWRTDAIRAAGNGLTIHLMGLKISYTQVPPARRERAWWGPAGQPPGPFWLVRLSWGINYRRGGYHGLFRQWFGKRVCWLNLLIPFCRGISFWFYLSFQNVPLT